MMNETCHCKKCVVFKGLFTQLFWIMKRTKKYKLTLNTGKTIYHFTLADDKIYIQIKQHLNEILAVFIYI